VSEQPSLETERLRLRPLTLEDAGTVRRLAGEREIAATTVMIPHPYPQGVAEAWIEGHVALFEAREAAVFAIVEHAGGDLVGSIGISLKIEHRNGELGYWIGQPWWGRGYATEAARAVLRFGFETMKLHRIHSHHMTRNAASGRVLEKIGMKPEGELREHVLKWGEYEDLRWYGILEEEWEGAEGLRDEGS